MKMVGVGKPTVDGTVIMLASTHFLSNALWPLTDGTEFQIALAWTGSPTSSRNMKTRQPWSMFETQTISPTLHCDAWSLLSRRNGGRALFWRQAFCMTCDNRG